MKRGGLARGQGPDEATTCKSARPRSTSLDPGAAACRARRVRHEGVAVRVASRAARCDPDADPSWRDVTRSRSRSRRRLRLQANKLIGDPKALNFTTADPAVSAVFVVDDGASLTNNTGATDPMIMVGTTPTEFYLVFNQEGTAEIKSARSGRAIAAGAILNVDVLTGGLSLDGLLQSSGWIGSDTAATVNWIHDGTMGFPPDFWPPGTFNPTNVGTNVNQPTGIVGGAGPLVNRPVFQGGGSPSIGCMYFATDYTVIAPNGSPIWFDGSNWRDTAGTVVP